MPPLQQTRPDNIAGVKTSHSVVEAVPNVSEGCRSEVIDELAATIQTVSDVNLLDIHTDPTHNRSVFTLMGPPNAVKDALIALIGCSLERIDLRNHTGVHPRIGAVDVIPLVPVGTTAMAICVTLATELGHEVASRFGLPIYLYGEAARVPERRRLEQVRRGEFEGLPGKMREPAWNPDFGPSLPHPSGGATAIGARRVLIAFNINLNTGDLDIARRIAHVIRASSGGLPAVKAIGVPTARADVVQVSINLVDPKQTALHHVVETVAHEARRFGVSIQGSELIGLLPADSVLDAAAHALRLDRLTGVRVLESHLPR